MAILTINFESLEKLALTGPHFEAELRKPKTLEAALKQIGGGDTSFFGVRGYAVIHTGLYNSMFNSQALAALHIEPIEKKVVLAATKHS